MRNYGVAGLRTGIKVGSKLRVYGVAEPRSDGLAELRITGFAALRDYGTEALRNREVR